MAKLTALVRSILTAIQEQPSVIPTRSAGTATKPTMFPSLLRVFFV